MDAPYDMPPITGADQVAVPPHAIYDNGRANGDARVRAMDTSAPQGNALDVANAKAKRLIERTIAGAPKWLTPKNTLELALTAAFTVREQLKAELASLRTDVEAKLLAHIRAEIEALVAARRSFVADGSADRIAALEKRLAELERRKSFSYRGIFTEGDDYEEGDFCTHQGSLWHCNVTGTRQRPGQGSDWQLCVKRGKAAA